MCAVGAAEVGGLAMLGHSIAVKRQGNAMLVLLERKERGASLDAHARAGSNKPLYLGHPEFEGFTVLQEERADGSRMDAAE